MGARARTKLDIRSKLMIRVDESQWELEVKHMQARVATLILVLVIVYTNSSHFCLSYKFQNIGMTPSVLTYFTRLSCPPVARNTRKSTMHSKGLLHNSMSSVSNGYKTEQFMKSIMWNAKRCWKNMAVILPEKSWCCSMVPRWKMLRKLMPVAWTETTLEKMVWLKSV